MSQQKTTRLCKVGGFMDLSNRFLAIPLTQEVLES